MTWNPRARLHGLKVISFESRRAVEMAELIRRYGGEPMIAPAMREVPLEENHQALELLPQIEAGQLEMLILMTGVGTKILHNVLLTRYGEERILAALQKIRLLARGPKPLAALKALGVQAAAVAPEPSTWREIVATIDSRFSVSGRRIAIQEYGVANPELAAALVSRGGAVTTIPIYRWTLPDDTTPLRQAIRAIMNVEADVALFTNGAQVDHVFRVAAQDGLADGLRASLPRVVIGSVGPVCTRVLQQYALKPDLEPSHPKMGSLLAEIAAWATLILATKRGV